MKVGTGSGPYRRGSWDLVWYVLWSAGSGGAMKTLLHAEYYSGVI